MRVTVAIPFYNAAATLSDAIRSVFAQTYRDWELLLVDDGSTDDSAALARSVRDDRVRVLTDEKNLGLSARLNQIARAARGDLLARMDADDLMHPDRLTRQVQYLDAHPRVDVVGTGVFSIDEQNTITGMRGTELLNLHPMRVLAGEVWVHPTITGRRTWFLRHPYDPDYLRAEDRELWLRTYRTSWFARIPDPLLFYREPLQRSTVRNYLTSCRTVRAIFRRYGPNICGPWPTRRLIALSYLKGAAYWLCHGVQAQELLIRRRNHPVAEEISRDAAQLLAQILRTPVTGLQRDERHEAAIR